MINQCLAFTLLNDNKRLDTTKAMPPIITTETVFSLLNKINTNKSNGQDKIPNWVLKEYTSILAAPVTSLINSSLKARTNPPPDMAECRCHTNSKKFTSGNNS